MRYESEREMSRPAKVSRLGFSESQVLNVDEVIAALVAFHRQLTCPPFLDLRPRRGLVVGRVHLTHDGLDAGAACGADGQTDTESEP